MQWLVKKFLHLADKISNMIIENNETQTPDEALGAEQAAEVGQGEQTQPQEAGLEEGAVDETPIDAVPEPEPRELGNVYSVLDATGNVVRDYSNGIHGDDAESLAQQFATKIGGSVQ